MLRVARMYVSTRAVAEEVVQETWLGVISGIGRFEGRSSLKTWIFRILTNRAKTRGEREGRSLPFSSLAGRRGDDEPTVDADRFQRGGAVRRALDIGAVALVRAAREPARREGDDRRRAGRDRCAPETQRAVITMRDVDGWSSEDVRNVLGLSESNQRVLLHRARAKVRRALESYLEGDRS